MLGDLKDELAALRDGSGVEAAEPVPAPPLSFEAQHKARETWQIWQTLPRFWRPRYRLRRSRWLQVNIRFAAFQFLQAP